MGSSEAGPCPRRVPIVPVVQTMCCKHAYTARTPGGTIGYESEEAFNRAFKRAMGNPWPNSADTPL